MLEINIEVLTQRVAEARSALDAANADLSRAQFAARETALSSRPALEDADWRPHVLCSLKTCGFHVTADGGMLSFEDPEECEVIAEAPIDAIRALIKVYDENPDLR